MQEIWQICKEIWQICNVDDLLWKICKKICKYADHAKNMQNMHSPPCCCQVVPRAVPVPATQIGFQCHLRPARLGYNYDHSSAAERRGASLSASLRACAAQIVIAKVTVVVIRSNLRMPVHFHHACWESGLGPVLPPASVATRPRRGGGSGKCPES